MLSFRQWLETREPPRANIFVDLDNTLIAYDPKGRPYKRPGADDFIRNLKRIGRVTILTHGETIDQTKAARKVGIHLQVIGRDKYKTVKPDHEAILIDNLGPDYAHTKDKEKALHIPSDRVIKVKAWTYRTGYDEELRKAFIKIKHLLHLNEWVERNPQPVPKKQEFKTYDKAKQLAKERLKKFRRGMKEAADGHKVVVGIKSRGSFKDKTQNRGKPAQKVFDILRGAIVVDRKNQVNKIVDNLKRTFVVKKVEHKTKPEEFGYYGAVHVDVLVDDLICEIQVMPKRIWECKMLTDKVYHKYRSVDRPPQEEVEWAKKMYRKANGD